MLKHADVDKAAPRGERARIEELIASQEARVRRAFRQFLDTVRSNEVRRQVRLALERGSIEDALAIVDAHVAKMGGVIVQVFQAAGVDEAEALARQLGGQRAAVAVSFDPSDPRAAGLLRRSRLEFVREFTRTQRESARAAIVESLQSGFGPVQTARAFRDSIGLTETQRRAVASYRRALEMNDASALQRDLRDRRFLREDTPARDAFLSGEPLGPKKIQSMVERYRTRYLQYRAETIARTETQSVVNQARQEALQQVLTQTGIPGTGVSRVWRATKDQRTRDSHATMDGQERRMTEPFESPLTGARLMYPGDRSLGAPASEVINCRCVLINRIK